MSARDASVPELVIGAAVVIVALLTLLVPRRLASVVSFLVFGVLLSVLWALAGAPDVALAEAALGTGVTGVLFIDAVTRTRTASRQDAGDPPIADDDTAPSRRASPTTVLSLAATVGVTVLLTVGLVPALWRAARPLDGASPGLTDAVARVLPETGVEHAVTGVLLNLRSYDTLLEVVVLLVAVPVASARVRTCGHVSTTVDGGRGTPAAARANPPASTHTPGMNRASVSATARTDRNGRLPTTGPNWWTAPSTAVVRNARSPTCTALTAPEWVGVEGDAPTPDSTFMPSASPMEWSSAAI